MVACRPEGAIGVAVARLGGEILRLTIETVAITKVAGFLTRSMGMAWIAVVPLFGVVVILPFVGWTTPAVAPGIDVLGTWCAWFVVRGRRSVGLLFYEECNRQ